MKIVIRGRSGQVGTILARAFHGDRHDVVVLSRRTQKCSWRVVEWDGATLGGWQRKIDGAESKRDGTSVRVVAAPVGWKAEVL